jgi:BioD-like phosphotransacetylase family protein
VLLLLRESLSQLAVHVEMASRLNAAVDSMKLAELSALEQSLVFGEASVKELIAYLTAAAGPAGCSQADKLRLLFAFTCMHPDKVRRI